MNQPATNVTRSQVEKDYGIPGWAIAEITKRLDIRPQYARLKAPDKREALHALYTHLQVIQIRADYDRIKREAKRRKETAAKERFSSEKQRKAHRSLRSAILEALDRIEARQERMERYMNLTPTFTKVPLTDSEGLSYDIETAPEARGVDR